MLWHSFSSVVEILTKEMVVLGGYFNAILYPTEKKGGRGWRPVS